jgi:hypothetical protein
MAITYPLAMPSGLQFSARNWRKQDVTVDIPSPFTGQSQVVSFPGQWVEVTLTLIAMRRADAQDWSGWLTSLKGHVGTFLLGDPLRPTPLGSAASAAGTPLVMGGAQTGNTLAVDGLPFNATNYLKRGDLINLGTGASTELYEVQKDVSSNGSGEATLDIWPNLRTSPANNAAVVVAGAQGLFHRMVAATDWQVGEDGLSRLTFDAKERLV